MSYLGASHPLPARRSRWMRFMDIRITPLEIAIILGGAVLVGFIGAASAAALNL
jgi:hypothetical protein